MTLARNVQVLVALGALSVVAAGCRKNESRKDAPPPAAEPAPAVSAPAAAQQPPKDSDVAAALKSAFARDPGVDQRNIDVKVTNGVAELTGKVDNLLSKRRAVLLAETVRGVRSVSDRIQLERKERPDAEIQKNVKDALLFNAATDSFEIEPRSENAVVTLTGKVQSWQERQIAERMAEGVRGVREVKNEITVDFGKPRGDVEIERDVESAFRWDRLLDAGLIRVEVKDQKVTLRGNVGSAAERRRAYRMAWVNGVNQVDHSALEVAPWAKEGDVRETEHVKRPDTEIVRAIQDAAALDPRVETADLRVRVAGGVATLSGTVHSFAARMAAESLAKNTVGVSSVKNELSVEPEKPVADKVVADNVRNALVYDPITDSYQIDVKVSDGTVTLTGKVETSFESAEATDVATRINGVKRVQNRLEVQRPNQPYVYSFYLEPYAPFVERWYYAPASPGQPDADIMQDIKDELFWSPFVDAKDVNVTVAGGTATLTGSVDSYAEREAATENAFEGGATVVDNRLSVKP